MKKLLALLVLSTSLAHAAEVTVLEAELMQTSSTDMVDTRFQVDRTTGEGKVTVTVSRQEYNHFPEYPGPMGCDMYGRCYPNQWNRMPVIVTVFDKTVAVEGLALHGDRVIYAAAEGDVDCGKLGVSRVLRKPTIFLTGNCKLNGKIRGHKLTVTLKTK